MQASFVFALLLSAPLVAAKFLTGSTSCVAEDLKHRAQLQNKLAGVCVDMCKEVGAFPKCTCPDFVAPDSTPGVMTWPELLEHMDNLSEWGHGELKAWKTQASALIDLHVVGADSEEACLAEDIKHRAQVQNKLAGVCVDMCKEVGAFPKCTCPDFVAPDSTPGVMTWPELLEHMDNLSEWGHGELKAWSKQASSAFVQQDPCAGCDESLAEAYQKCAMAHGNPCAERNEAGIVTAGPGAKKDISCCLKKEKHDRCLECSSMDCAYKTCNVNKKYYSPRTIVGELDDKKAMKKAGWGK
jgi:hypothetical protein